MWLLSFILMHVIIIRKLKTDLLEILFSQNARNFSDSVCFNLISSIMFFNKHFHSAYLSQNSQFSNFRTYRKFSEEYLTSVIKIETKSASSFNDKLTAWLQVLKVFFSFLILDELLFLKVSSSILITSITKKLSMFLKHIRSFIWTIFSLQVSFHKYSELTQFKNFWWFL